MKKQFQYQHLRIIRYVPPGFFSNNIVLLLSKRFYHDSFACCAKIISFLKW